MVSLDLKCKASYAMLAGSLCAVFFAPLGKVGLFLGILGLFVAFISLIIMLLPEKKRSTEDLEAILVGFKKIEDERLNKARQDIKGLSNIYYKEE